ncbi:MAG: hypothetical protein PHH11_09635 [Methylomonas sp.]|nr:hypothetical protein [Methylomonas sp.]
MSKKQPPQPESTAPAQLNLVSSKRLLALRHTGTDDKNSDAPSITPETPALTEDRETARLRMLINQRLAEIMDQLPTGKQNNLFKIRYGVTSSEIRLLPPKRAARILKIKAQK